MTALLFVATLAGSPNSSHLVNDAAASSLNFIGCANSSTFSCTSLAVSLDRAGAVPGTLSLSVERRLAGASPSRSAVVALAGGPGQAALPLAEFIAQVIAPALGSRDLLVFDQRGTGASDPLSCPAFEAFNVAPAAEVFGACASQLGPARGAFTTQESVQDIEALREAGGYEKLVLYGTSYGTKVALEYAERYPQNVEALVLDSVVPSDGWEPLHISSFQAMDGVLAELCSNGACAGITADPLGELATLAAQLGKRPLRGSVYDGSGRRHTMTLDERGLLDILEAGDLNPALRALLPAAVRSALRHDPDPLLRLRALSEGLIPSVPSENATTEASPEVDEALYAATICEESPFPWSRSAPSATRMQEASAFLRTQPASAFYPFNASTAFNDSIIPACAGWPDASAPPPATTGLPNVPTLILSGAQDLRTPTANARTVAAQIPDAQLLVVPYTGHSVLGSDLSDCSANAVKAFFGGAPVEPCTATTDPFAPTPITPTRLAFIHPPGGLRGRPGKTLVAVLDTLVDLNRQVIAATLQADQELPHGSSFGGLHGGYARFTGSTVVLKGFTFVPGVQLTATFPVREAKLQATNIRVSGTQAAGGNVHFGGTSTRVSGTLGGRRFDINVAAVKLARVGSGASSPEGEWLSLASLAGHLALRRAAAGAGRLP